MITVDVTGAYGMEGTFDAIRAAAFRDGYCACRCGECHHRAEAWSKTVALRCGGCWPGRRAACIEFTTSLSQRDATAIAEFLTRFAEGEAKLWRREGLLP